MPTEKEKLM